MTDAILGVVFEKSISLIQKEFSTISGLRKKTEKLSNTLRLVRAVLQDAEERQMKKDEAVKVWLQQLRDAAHVLDDILDDCTSDPESLQLGCLSSLRPTNIRFRYRVGHKLKEMMERLEQIAKDKNTFGLRENNIRERPREVGEWRLTSSIIASPQVYGRDEDKKQVVQFLLSSEQRSNSLLVYAIVGLGGLGKTTLSQLVYNDETMINHFNLKIWICVSENFSLIGILRSIIESVKKVKCDISELDAMGQEVLQLLQGKRYLLVLDDVWKRSENMEFGLSQEKWDQLRSVLSCGPEGSSILVSTRDKEVAQIMGACQTHDLPGLSEDDCWSLFKQNAFGTEREEHPELVRIGKEIVKKCGGSPLAAKALGGVMLTRSSEKEWLEVLKSELWTLPDENDILPALRLSYFHLTPTLKQCFAFCAIFPKDKEIEKHELIHLWMANGFISSRENLAVEEVGNMVWDEFYRKSFFQDVAINKWGNISFKMHDLVHDLAQSISEKECICLEDKKLKDLPRNTHHIGSRYGGQITSNKKAFEKFDSLRTIYQFQAMNNDSMEPISFWFPSSLRVLITNTLGPLLSGNLTHLRYLELQDLSIEILPDSIYNLRKLEILKLIRLKELVCLPNHLTRLKRLRHLVIESCESLSKMCPNMHKLSELRTLSVYVVNTEIGHSLAELRHLNLGGQLSIEGLGNIGSLSEAEDADLKGKQDILELILSWKKSDETKPHAIDDGQVLEALQPHPNLKLLNIWSYKGLEWPSWMGNNSSVLNNLGLLIFYDCPNCRQLPPIGKLPHLKTLYLYFMENVEYVDGDDECYDGVDMRPFPSLETFYVHGLPNLKRFLKMKTSDDMFPSLSHLVVFDCPKLESSFIASVEYRDPPPLILYL